MARRGTGSGRGNNMAQMAKDRDAKIDQQIQAMDRLATALAGGIGGGGGGGGGGGAGPGIGIGGGGGGGGGVGRVGRVDPLSAFSSNSQWAAMEAAEAKAHMMNERLAQERSAETGRSMFEAYATRGSGTASGLDAVKGVLTSAASSVGAFAPAAVLGAVAGGVRSHLAAEGRVAEAGISAISGASPNRPEAMQNSQRREDMRIARLQEDADFFSFQSWNQLGRGGPKGLAEYRLQNAREQQDAHRQGQNERAVLGSAQASLQDLAAPFAKIGMRAPRELFDALGPLFVRRAEAEVNAAKDAAAWLDKNQQRNRLR